MSSIYHPLGFWNGLLRRPAWHLREYWRSAEYRALHRFARRLGGLPRHNAATVSFGQYTIELCDGPSFLSAWDEIFVNRIYEVAVREGEKPVLVDAGANIGLAALFWKTRMGEFDYLGFEPDPAVAALCRRNLEAWGVRGRLEERALAETEGEQCFVADGADGGRLTDGEGDGVTVKTERLSQWLPERVDLLKVDVEGAEGGVLRDIGPFLDRIRNLFVEWHYRAGEGGLGRAIALLEEAGFDCHVKVAQGPRQPFMREPVCGRFSQYLNLYAVRR
ncbi:FkbM family methyltransferase [Synoicihabitans lomoniglobus]|uniref:FkbM family methyltransferase n=1 Tax=Synoicihabitans lomoniglobus TaxID=2909285 RepID=A0AAF0CSK8_9BACT|nr:FkbM family methyltransferase [Opitutaceae bacterium LMO-M01]WED67280.1 FkbM family methyltransferase [Opitutaceae bacterium LMO-M01]